jgi:hypothetical protein
MGTPPRQCLKQIIQETENAINQVNANQQEAIRYLATKNLRRIASHNYLRTIDYKQDMHTAKQIKLKLQQNNATIIEADKGKTMVVIYKQDLENKVNTFIKENDTDELKTDPTQRMQKKKNFGQDKTMYTHNRPQKTEIHNSNAPTST